MLIRWKASAFTMITALVSNVVAASSQSTILPDTPANRARGVVGCLQTTTGIDCSNRVPTTGGSGLSGLETANTILQGLMPLISSIIEQQQQRQAQQKALERQRRLERERRRAEFEKDKLATLDQMKGTKVGDSSLKGSDPSSMGMKDPSDWYQDQRWSVKRVTSRVQPLLTDLYTSFAPPEQGSAVDLRLKGLDDGRPIALQNDAAPMLLGWAELEGRYVSPSDGPWNGLSEPALDASGSGFAEKLEELKERSRDKLVDWAKGKMLDQLPQDAVRPFKQLYDEGKELHDFLSGHTEELLNESMARARIVAGDVSSPGMEGDGYSWSQHEDWMDSRVRDIHDGAEKIVTGKKRGLFPAIFGEGRPPTPSEVLAAEYRSRWPF